jgi:hypothetical protein
MAVGGCGAVVLPKTRLYRLSAVEQPFGRESFWRFDDGRAKLTEVAEVDAGESVPAGLPRWMTEVEVPDANDSDAMSSRNVGGRLERARRAGELAELRSQFLTECELSALRGRRWVQLMEQGTVWALVYMGDEPLHAEPVPD